jgi:hypothetical protein
VSFLDASLNQLRPGGFYVIEDILTESIGRWHEHLRTVCSKRWPDHEFAFIELPNTINVEDNNMVVIRRRR